MKKLSALVLSTILCASTAAFAEEDKTYSYQFSVDGNKQTALTGADWSMSIIEGYRQLEDKIDIPTNQFMNALMVIPRLLVTNYVSTFQHEVFGHGARAREFGWKNIKYKLRLDGTGSTSFRYPVKDHKQYMAAMDLGGTQATEVLSYKLKERFTASEHINPVYGAAYINSAGDQPAYVFLTKYKEGKGHDIQNYIDDMNTMYGANYITKSKIKQRTLLSLADPFMFFSLYALATNEDFEYPMINIGEFGYLPAFRAVFTPYGLENKFINYIRTPATPLQISLSQGKNKTGTSLKGELIVDKLLDAGNITLGANLAIWKQPKLFVADVTKAPNKTGYLAEVKVNLIANDMSSVYGSFGYKSSGFMVGYPLKASTLARVGVAFNF